MSEDPVPEQTESFEPSVDQSAASTSVAPIENTHSNEEEKTTHLSSENNHDMVSSVGGALATDSVLSGGSKIEQHLDMNGTQQEQEQAQDSQIQSQEKELEAEELPGIEREQEREEQEQQQRTRTDTLNQDPEPSNAHNNADQQLHILPGILYDKPTNLFLQQTTTPSTYEIINPHNRNMYPHKDRHKHTYYVTPTDQTAALELAVLLTNLNPIYKHGSLTTIKFIPKALDLPPGITVALQFFQYCPNCQLFVTSNTSDSLFRERHQKDLSRTRVICEEMKKVSTQGYRIMRNSQTGSQNFILIGENQSIQRRFRPDKPKEKSASIPATTAKTKEQDQKPITVSDDDDDIVELDSKPVKSSTSKIFQELSGELMLRGVTADLPRLRPNPKIASTIEVETGPGSMKNVVSNREEHVRKEKERILREKYENEKLEREKKIKDLQKARKVHSDRLKKEAELKELKRKTQAESLKVKKEKLEEVTEQPQSHLQPPTRTQTEKNVQSTSPAKASSSFKTLHAQIIAYKPLKLLDSTLSIIEPVELYLKSIDSNEITVLRLSEVDQICSFFQLTGGLRELIIRLSPSNGISRTSVLDSKFKKFLVRNKDKSFEFILKRNITNAIKEGMFVLEEFEDLDLFEEKNQEWDFVSCDVPALEF